MVIGKEKNVDTKIHKRCNMRHFDYNKTEIENENIREWLREQ